MKNKLVEGKALIYILSALYIIIGGVGVVHPILFSVYLISILGAFFLLNGINNLYEGIKNMKDPSYHWGMSVFLGIMEIILSLSIFVHPVVSEIYLIIYVGMLILIRGLFILLNEGFGKNRPKTHHTSGAVISILFGGLLVGAPLLSNEMIVLMIAWFIILSGVNLLVIAIGGSRHIDR